MFLTFFVVVLLTASIFYIIEEPTLSSDDKIVKITKIFDWIFLGFFTLENFLKIYVVNLPSKNETTKKKIFNITTTSKLFKKLLEIDFKIENN